MNKKKEVEKQPYSSFEGLVQKTPHQSRNLPVKTPEKLDEDVNPEEGLQKDNLSRISVAEKSWRFQKMVGLEYFFVADRNLVRNLSLIQKKSQVDPPLLREHSFEMFSYSTHLKNQIGESKKQINRD